MNKWNKFKTLNIFSWLDEYKLQHLYSEHKKPNVILTDSQKLALCIRYDEKTMKAPIMEIKGKYSYAQKIINAGKINDIMIVNEPGLANEMFDDTKEGKEIPEKYFSAIAKILIKLYRKDLLLLSKEKKLNQFNDLLVEQRKKEDEIFSVYIPKKIELQLSKTLFALAKEHIFNINIFGIQITNVNITEDSSCLNEEFCIKINGVSLKYGKLSYISIDPMQQLSIHLSDVLSKNIVNLFGRDDVFNTINHVKEEYPILINEVMKCFSIGEIRQVLCGLLEEKVSIKNLITIFESMADLGEKRYQIDDVIDQVRVSIGREICSPHLSDEKILWVVGLSNKLERVIEKNMIKTNDIYEIKPVVISIINEALDSIKENTLKPLIYWTKNNRRVLFNKLKSDNPQITIISSLEVPKDITFQYSHILDVPNDIS